MAGISAEGERKSSDGVHAIVGALLCTQPLLVAQDEEIYTKQGIDWVEETSMKDVILRHFPTLAFAIE